MSEIALLGFAIQDEASSVYQPTRVVNYSHFVQELGWKIECQAVLIIITVASTGIVSQKGQKFQGIFSFITSTLTNKVKKLSDRVMPSSKRKLRSHLTGS